MVRTLIVAASLLMAALTGASPGSGRGDSSEPEPRPPAELVPGTCRYEGTLRVLGQTESIGLVTEIRDAGDVWAVKDTWRLGSDVATQTSELEKDTLSLQRFHLRNGVYRLEYEIRDGRLTGRRGTVAFGRFEARWEPLSIEVGGPVFADGAGVPQAVAALPLAEGYSTRFINLELGLYKPVVHKTLTVVGREKIEVPSGAVPAWRVDVAADEPGAHTITVWVAVDSRRVLRFDAPSVAGGPAYSLVLQDSIGDRPRP
jgi:hypothetical protein